MVQAGAIPPVRFLALTGFATRQLACMLYSLVRVSRRVEWKLNRQHPVAAVPEGRSGHPPRAPRRHRRDINPRCCPASPPDADQRPAHAAGRRAGISPGAPVASIPFPLNNFKHFLTLFSKFFSPFPHGTCSLSVSRQYLALDGIYHLLWAAFPNNPTLRKRLVRWRRGRLRGSHPLGRPLPGDLSGRCHRGCLSRLQFAARRAEIFKLGSSRFARRY
jgi:hypothetical protein